MKISETTFPFLEADCLRIFGGERGRSLFRRTEEIYQDLLDHADDRGSDAIRSHLYLKLFPPMAYYKALRADGLDQQKALEYVRLESRKAAENKREQMRRLSNLPFAYAVYRACVKKYMRTNFPQEGWETEWIRCDGAEIHFNLHRCLYWDLTNKYGCPELCRIYCENDTISFSGLLPKIRFERSGTLADGADCCDFHFIKR